MTAATSSWDGRHARHPTHTNTFHMGYTMHHTHLILALGLMILPKLQAQTPLGAAIVGESAGDGSGVSVALDSSGSRMAIGAYQNDGSGPLGTNSGHVRVYDWTGSSWVQLGSDIDGEPWFSGSGYSIAMAAGGNRVAIGAPDNDVPGVGAGHVRVYDWNGSAWLQAGLDIDGQAPGDQAGHSVAMSASGNRIAIGAFMSNGNGLDAGRVRIYDWVGASWSLIGEIDGASAGDWSGYSVDLSSDGTRLAIGATHSNGGGIGGLAGHVRVYQEAGGAWQLLGNEITGEAAGDIFGYDVSLSADGGRIAVGAAYNNGVHGPRSGHVRVYEWASGGWVQVGGDIDGKAAGDESGSSVALSANGCRVVIGAVHNDGGGVGVNTGHFRIYDWSGVAWIEAADIGGEAAGDFCGSAVAMSADGGRAAAGSMLSHFGAGHVRAWLLSGPGSGNGSIQLATVSRCPSPMTIAVSGSPNIGNVITIDLSGATGTPLAGFGFAPMVPMPSPCTCSLIGDGQGGVGSFLAAASRSLTIPCDTAFIGAQLMCQGIDLFPAPVGCTVLGIPFGLTDIWTVTIG